MRLRYNKKDGTQMEFELGERPITIGRSPDADVVILDEKSSRIHCGIRFWDGDFYIKDLKSKNGTVVNGEKVDVAKLEPGDRIQVGSVTMLFEQEQNSAGPDTVLHEMEEQMSSGKGYSTILREIVDTVEEHPSPQSLRAQDTSPGDEEEPIRVKTRKNIAEDE